MTKVTDGDTVHVLVDGTTTAETVRIIGIDTPETVDPRKPVQCYGPEASANAKNELSGQRVTLVDDPTQDPTDMYKRDLRYVDVDAVQGAAAYDYGRDAIARGFARTDVYEGVAGLRDPDYEVALHDAQVAKLGIWGPKASGGCDGGL